MLSRDGVNAWTSGIIYVVVVKAVLLYGWETWVLTPYIGSLLGGFRHRVSHMLIGRQPQRGGWGWAGVSSTGGRDVVGKVTGCGGLHLPSTEHSHTVHCDQAHYGPVYGGGEASGVMGCQAVMGTSRFVLGRNVDSGSGGGMGGGGDINGTEM